MKIQSLFKNITIKQANFLTVFIIFLFTLLFVGVLVEQMYEDYSASLEKNILIEEDLYSDSEFLEKKQKNLKSFFIKIVLVIVTLSFILFGIFLGLNNIFNRLLQRDTKTFLNFFEKAAHNNQVINPTMIFFKDFKIMVSYVNEMVSKVNEQKNLLEDRVKERTSDLQKEKNFSQELLKSQKEFLRYAVHETNTPLSIILASIELYTMKHEKDRQLTKIEVSVKNIFSIYDDLSYLVKKDQIEYPKSVINLQQYLNSRLDFFKEVAELSRLSFSYEYDKEEMHIHFNETKLQRIVDNTITNAIKYTLADELVIVELKEIGANLELSIASKSKTIQDTNRVFDSFYREENTKSGFGLGLGLVRNICNEEGVEIALNSSEEKTSFAYKFKMIGV